MPARQSATQGFLQGLGAGFMATFPRNYERAREVMVERKERQQVAAATEKLAEQFKSTYNEEALAGKRFEEVLQRRQAGEEVPREEWRAAWTAASQAPINGFNQRMMLTMAADAEAGGMLQKYGVTKQLMDADQQQLRAGLSWMQGTGEQLTRESVTGQTLEAQAAEGEAGREARATEGRLGRNAASYENFAAREGRLDEIRLRAQLQEQRDAKTRSFEDALTKKDLLLASEAAVGVATEQWGRIQPEEKQAMLDKFNQGQTEPYALNELEDAYIRDQSKALLVHHGVIEPPPEQPPGIAEPADPNLDLPEAPTPVSAEFRAGQETRRQVTTGARLGALGPGFQVAEGFFGEGAAEDSEILQGIGDYFSGVATALPARAKQ